MAPKISTYEKHQKRIDQWQKDGLSLDDIVAKLRDEGITITKQGLSKAKANWERKNAEKLYDQIPLPEVEPSLERYVKIHHPEVWTKWKKHLVARTEQWKKQPFPIRIKQELDAAVMEGKFTPAQSSAIHQRSEALLAISEKLASFYLYLCLTTTEDRWAMNFDFLMQMAGEITQSMGPFKE